MQGATRSIRTFANTFSGILFLQEYSVDKKDIFSKSAVQITRIKFFPAYKFRKHSLGSMKVVPLFTASILGSIQLQVSLGTVLMRVSQQTNFFLKSCLSSSVFFRLAVLRFFFCRRL